MIEKLPGDLPDTTSMRNQRGGSGRGQGRKPISEGQETVTVSIRLTAGQRQKLDMLGGAAWVRKWIDAGYQDACEAADKADFLEILLLSVLEKTGPVIISKNFELLPDRRRCLWITRATDDESDVVECRRHVI